MKKHGTMFLVLFECTYFQEGGTGTFNKIDDNIEGLK